MYSWGWGECHPFYRYVVINQKLIIAVDEKSEGHKTCLNNSDWDMNVYNKFYGNPSNSCQDISLKTVNVNLTVALEEVRGSRKSLGFILWKTMNVVDVDILQFKRKLWPGGGATGKPRGPPKSLGFILWVQWMSVQNFILIQPTVVDTFQSGPKAVDQLTHCHP